MPPLHYIYPIGRMSSCKTEPGDITAGVLRSPVKAPINVLRQLNSWIVRDAEKRSVTREGIFISIFDAQCCISLTLCVLVFDIIRCRGPPFDI